MLLLKLTSHAPDPVHTALCAVFAICFDTPHARKPHSSDSISSSAAIISSLIVVPRLCEDRQHLAWKASKQRYFTVCLLLAVPCRRAWRMCTNRVFCCRFLILDWCDVCVSK
jgi:hypothetical protein